MTKKPSRYIVSREKTGRLVISKRASARPPKGEQVISADLERFSDVNIARPAVRPKKETELAIRRAVRETMKQNPLEQS